MTERGPLHDQNDAPEDVATLYSWANLHGAKYRDFSESRAQTREKARLRVQQAIEEEQARTHEQMQAERHVESQRIAEAAQLEEEAREAERAAQQAALETAQRAAQQAEHYAAQQAAQQAAQEAAHRAAQLAAQQAAQLAAQQAAKVAAQEAAQLAAQQAAQAAAEQAAQLAAEQEAARQAAHLAAQEAAGLTAQQSAHQAAQEAAENASRQIAEKVTPEVTEIQERPARAAQWGGWEQPQVDPYSAFDAQETEQPIAPQISTRAEYTPPPAQRSAAGQRHPAPMRDQAPMHEDRPMSPRGPWGQMEQREQPGRPAWLMPEHGEQPEQPNEGSAPEDSLQESRDRLASRWYALRGVFEGGVAPQEVAPAAQPARAPVVAVFSLAGGVGKTSLVATLGRALSGRGERVLLVDTAAFGLMPFFFGAHDQRPGVLRTFSPPGTSVDAPIQMVTLDPESLGPETATQEALTAEIGKYSRGVSRVIVDLATASGATSRRVVRMAPLVLVPMIPDMNSVVSVSSIDSFFQHNGNGGPNKSMPYYVLNQFDPSLPLHLDIREVLREQLGDRMLPFVLRRSPVVSEALAEGMTVMDYAPNSTVAEDFGNLAGWVKSQSAAASSTYRGVRWSER
jgi:cellulose synthase operon protein YhjQ